MTKLVTEVISDVSKINALITKWSLFKILTFDISHKLLIWSFVLIYELLLNSLIIEWIAILVRQS